MIRYQTERFKDVYKLNQFLIYVKEEDVISITPVPLLKGSGTTGTMLTYGYQSMETEIEYVLIYKKKMK